MNKGKDSKHEEYTEVGRVNKVSCHIVPSFRFMESYVSYAIEPDG